MNSTIALKSHHGKYLCAEQNGNVVANREKQAAWETFTVETLDDGHVALKSCHGKYLCAESSGRVVADRTHRLGWETFRAFHFGNHEMALQSCHGKYLCAEPSGRVVADRGSRQGWETFTVEYLDGEHEHEIDEEWFEKNEEAVTYINKFVEHCDDELIATLKEYVAAIPEICSNLQGWIDDLQVQETAINATNTTTTAVSVISTFALFTPFAAFGVAGLVASGVGAAATTAGDLIANSVKGQKIKEIAESKKDLMLKAEQMMTTLNDLIKKVAEVGKIPIVTASQICFGLVGVTKSAVVTREMLKGGKFGRLMGLFRVWKAGQLAPGGVSAIRGVSLAGSKAIGFLGAVVGVWTTVDGWVNGNPTKNATIKMKTDFENSEKAMKQLIDLIEGKQGV